MISDIGTIMWKEGKEILAIYGSRRGGALGMLIFIGLLGIYWPLQAGRDWVTSPVSLAYWVWVPPFLVSTVVADSFAGERERHTLETLLATRLPDRAILLGKIAAAVAYGWGFTLMVMLLGLVAVNVVHGRGQLLLYPLGVVLSGTVLSVLAALMAATIGVLVSLQASTVRQAQQSLSIGLLVLVFVPIVGIQLIPSDIRERFLEMAVNAGVEQLVALAAAFLLSFDVGLLLATIARFQRSKLII
ncbi:MAG: ABC transporter permease subunit [Chloroflexota bacterium]